MSIYYIFKTTCNYHYTYMYANLAVLQIVEIVEIVISWYKMFQSC